MSTPKAISDMIRFQEGTVVSREILRKTGTTITLFAFDKGQGLSEHTTPFDALVILTEGTAEITVGGIKHKVEAGEMLVMPANTPHALKAISPFKMILTMAK